MAGLDPAIHVNTDLNIQTRNGRGRCVGFSVHVDGWWGVVEKQADVGLSSQRGAVQQSAYSIGAGVASGTGPIGAAAAGALGAAASEYANTTRSRDELSLVTRLEEEPSVNPATRTREFSIRDPDGYYVAVNEIRKE